MTRDTFDMFDKPERGRFGDDETKQPRVTGASNLVDLDMVHHTDRSTAKAIFASFGNVREGKFLPRSQIEIEETGPLTRQFKGVYHQKVRITLPEWLARDKGLI